jgi:transposase
VRSAQQLRHAAWHASFRGYERGGKGDIAVTAPMVIEGAMNGPAFLAYIEQILGPTLKRGDIVMIDNLSVHKVAGVEEAIERRGARVEYLPKYSPDLNPIELSFSKFKVYLRKFSEQTIPALHRRVAAFIPTLSRAECRNYFRHAGYVSI